MWYLLSWRESFSQAMLTRLLKVAFLLSKDSFHPCWYHACFHGLLEIPFLLGFKSKIFFFRQLPGGLLSMLRSLFLLLLFPLFVSLILLRLLLRQLL